MKQVCTAALYWERKFNCCCATVSCSAYAVGDRYEQFGSAMRYTPVTGLKYQLGFVYAVSGFSTASTFAITGSEKRDAEGAPFFTVRVDGVVRLLDRHRFFHPIDGRNYSTVCTAQTIFQPTKNLIANMRSANIPKQIKQKLCEQALICTVFSSWRNAHAT